MQEGLHALGPEVLRRDALAKDMDVVPVHIQYKNPTPLLQLPRDGIDLLN